MSAVSSSPQPDLEGPGIRSRDYPPPTLENINWFFDIVWPGLKHLADSPKLLNSFLLRQAAYLLPAGEQRSWRELVRELDFKLFSDAIWGRFGQSHLTLLLRAPRAAKRQKLRKEQWQRRVDAFTNLLAELNTKWFIPRSLLLCRQIDPRLPAEPPPRLWETCRPALVGIRRTDFYSFADGVIPVHYIRRLDDSVSYAARHSCYYDASMGMVVLDEDYLKEQAYVDRLGAQGNSFVEEYLMTARRWYRGREVIERAFCECLNSRYPDFGNYCFMSSRRTLAEELRHAMDGIRSGDDSSLEEYYERMGEILLTREGSVRNRFWQPAHSGKSEELLYGEAVYLGKVLTELSAQMTAAAIPDPYLVLLEWWRKAALLAESSSSKQAQKIILRQHSEHILAGILGTILLGEYFKYGPSLDWSMLCEPDFAALAKLGARLFSHPDSELRLALKAIYQNEFNYPIDEFPFAEILPTGEIRNREPLEGRERPSPSCVG